MTIFFNFSLTSNHVHPLQVENCDSISRLVVDENDNGKFRLERVTLSMRNFLGLIVHYLLNKIEKMTNFRPYLHHLDRLSTHLQDIKMDINVGMNWGYIILA